MTSVLERAGYPPIEFAPHDVMPGIVQGQCPSEGYERGCGLASETLSHQIEIHPLYQEALKLASGRTIMSVDRLKNLFLSITTFLIADLRPQPKKRTGVSALRFSSPLRG